MTWLRSALFNLFFYTWTFIMVWPATLVRLLAPGRVLAVASFWARSEVRALQLICGIRIKITGLEHLPAQGPALIASRHESAFDTLVWYSVLPRGCFVLKRELLRIPLFGPLLTAAGNIAIDRSAGAGALRSLMHEGERAKEAGRQIVIFPEGTRADPGTRPPLQPGVAALARRLQLPIIPVATDSGRSWSRHGFLKRPGTIHLAIHPPLAPTLSRDVMMSHLADAITDLHWRGPRVDNSVGSYAEDLAMLQNKSA